MILDVMCSDWKMGRDTVFVVNSMSHVLLRYATFDIFSENVTLLRFYKLATDTWLWCQMNDGYSSHHWYMTMMSDEWRVQLTPLIHYMYYDVWWMTGTAHTTVHDYDVRRMTGTAHTTVHDYDVRWMTGTAHTTVHDYDVRWMTGTAHATVHDYDVRWMTGTAYTTDTWLWCQMNDGYSSHHWHWYMTMMSDEWRVHLTPLIHYYDVRWMTGTAHTTVHDYDVRWMTGTAHTTVHDYDVRWMTGTAHTTIHVYDVRWMTGTAHTTYMTMMSDEWRVQLTPRTWL